MSITFYNLNRNTFSEVWNIIANEFDKEVSPVHEILSRHPENLYWCVRVGSNAKAHYITRSRKVPLKEVISVYANYKIDVDLFIDYEEFRAKVFGDVGYE